LPATRELTSIVVCLPNRGLLALLASRAAIVRQSVADVEADLEVQLDCEFYIRDVRHWNHPAQPPRAGTVTRVFCIWARQSVFPNQWGFGCVRLNQLPELSLKMASVP
jgi:hypothetical protein